MLRKKGGRVVSEVKAWVVSVCLVTLLTSCAGHLSSFKPTAFRTFSSKNVSVAERDLVAHIWESSTRAYFKYTRQGPPSNYYQLLSTGEVTAEQLTPLILKNNTEHMVFTEFATIQTYWNSGVRGPRNFSLGTPEVFFLSPNVSELFSCISMNGWIIPNSTPPNGYTWPVNGTGYGAFTLTKVASGWEVSSNEASVSKIPGYRITPKPPKCNVEAN